MYLFIRRGQIAQCPRNSFCRAIGGFEPWPVNRIECVEHRAFLPRAIQPAYLPVLSRPPKNGTDQVALDSTLLSWQGLNSRPSPYIGDAWIRPNRHYF